MSPRGTNVSRSITFEKETRARERLRHRRKGDRYGRRLAPERRDQAEDDRSKQKAGATAFAMTAEIDFLHPAQVSIEAGPEGLVAARLLEWARVAGPRGLIHVARSETRAERLVRALRGLAPQLEVLMLPPWDGVPYDRAGPSRQTMGRRIAALR